MSLKTRLAPYFANHLPRQMREFYASNSLFDLGASMVAVFEPIYLYTIGYSVQKIIIFFLAGYALYFVIAPLGGRYARMHGYEHSIALSTPFLIGYFIALIGARQEPLLIFPAAVSFALFRTFYWPGVRAMLARYTTDEESGRALSGLVALSLLASLVGPIVGGAILSLWGFTPLFIVASGIILISNIPMLVTPERFEPHDLSYADAYKRLVRPEFRRTFFAHWGYGEEFISDIIWPIFILLLIPSYFAIGAVVTVGGLLTVVAIIVIGRFTDEHHRHPILHVGVLMTALTWFSRIVTISPFGVFASQSLYRVSRLTLAVPFLSIASKKAREYSVMKSSLFYEMSIVVGKMATAVLCLVILTFLSPGWWAVFLLAALLTLFYGLI